MFITVQCALKLKTSFGRVNETHRKNPENKMLLNKVSLKKVPKIKLLKIKL